MGFKKPLNLFNYTKLVNFKNYAFIIIKYKCLNKKYVFSKSVNADANCQVIKNELNIHHQIKLCITTYIYTILKYTPGEFKTLYNNVYLHNLKIYTWRISNFV